MRLFHNLKLHLAPPRIEDADFGSLRFVLLSKGPDPSYWECEWVFPYNGAPVFIGLPGDEHGPWPESRAFYLSLPERFEEIVAATRPKLEQVFAQWLKTPLPDDIFAAVKLSGFGLESPRVHPMHWDIVFEATGGRWLSITVPFVGDEPCDASVEA